MYKSLILATLAALTVFGLYKLTSQKENHSKFLQNDELQQKFNQWKLVNERSYGASEEQLRFNIFKQNDQKIEDHNQLLGSSYQLQHNEFSDLTNEEFVSIYTGLKMNKNQTNNQQLLGETEFADAIDWRTKNVVSPVKNQGSCGSCWAFSAVGAIESLYAIQNGQIQQFSEQALVDCSKPEGNEGCNGGLMDQAFQYVIQNGIPTEEEYKYTGRDGTCKTYTPKIVEVGFADVKAGSYNELMGAINIQPVAIAINAASWRFQFYFGGILDFNCSDDLDHGVLLVGYGTQDGKDYWLVKNSWGTWWGEKGYFKLRRDKVDGPGMCGIHQSASYPTNNKL